VSVQQTIRPHLDTGPARLFRQKIQGFVIAVLKKGCFTPISSLRHVVRETGNQQRAVVP
jgi:hypothetical protein